MKLEYFYVEGLSEIYAVAVGHKTGLFGRWDETERAVSFFSKPIHMGFGKRRREALEYLILHLTERSVNTRLSDDEIETLESAKALLPNYPPELVFPSLI